MAEMKYLDFDLLIEHSGDHYKARVLNSPAGQADVDFSLPFSEQDIEIFVLKVGRPRRSTRRMNSPEMEAAKVFGGRLFETVFRGEVLGCFRTSLYDATRKDAGLRVRLRVTNAPDLADLPWEYLYNPTLNRFLSLSVETPIVRYLELPEPIRPLTIKPPLRALVMISNPYDYPKLDTEQEWAKLKDAVGDLEREGLVTLERVEKATLSVLQRRLRQKEYHIYHFIGHGGFDKQALDGVLILEDEKERGRPINGQYLGTLLHDHRPLRLAILNACEGARASSSDPFAGTAQSLVQQGIPAVIAMQFEITDEAAITFADELYGALADGYPVDAALAEARKAIYAQGNDIEWGTPVLYMRSPDGRVFDIKRMSDEERREAKIAFLIRGTKAAVARENWQEAYERLREVLALDSTHSEARAILRHLPQEQALASLYAQGQEHYEAGSWSQALDCLRRVQEIRANYKNVNALVVAINEEIHQDRIAVLLHEAKEAAAKEDWRTVIEKYQAVLDLEPTHAEAKAGLSLARHEQELANFYAQGHQHYEAKRWSDALECFHRVQEIRAHFRQVDNLIASIERTLDEQRQHENVTVLISEAEEGIAKEDWATAIEKYHAALKLAPNHMEAKAGLSQARQEQHLAELYIQGQEHFQAKRLPQALGCFHQVRQTRADYRQVNDLITAVEQAQNEQRRQEEIVVLLAEAEKAVAQEHRTIAIEKFQAILQLEPTHAQAKGGLDQARQEQELAELYDQGQKHLQAKRLPQALDCLYQVKRSRANYKQVNDLIAAVEQAREEQSRYEQIAVLLNEAEKAVPKEDWRTAIKKYEAALKLESTHVEAKVGLSRARQEQELAKLYAQGQEHYEAKRWSQTLDCLRRVQAIRADYKQVNDLIAAVEQVRDEQNRRDKVTVLLREAKEAATKEDWRTVIEKYQAILELAPTHAEARTGLKQSQQEQELARLYIQGREHYEAKRWPQALDCLRRVQKIKPHYQQVENFIAAIERAQDEQSRREKITDLMREAKEAVAKEDWRTVSEKYQAVLKLEPNHAEAKAGLSQSQQEQELARLYAQGREHYDARRWPQAMKCFLQVQKIKANYKDVDALAAIVNKEMPKKDEGRAPVRRLVALASTVVLLAIIIFVWLSPRKDRPVPAVETTLSISTEPDQATVFLNDDSVGLTPSNFSTKAGMISLRLQKPGYITLDTSIVIKEGQPLSFSFPLEKIPPPSPHLGGVKITSIPLGASVWLNGQRLGETPYENNELQIGSFQLDIRQVGYEDNSQKITVQGGQTIEVAANLVALVGALKITSEPAGASIWLDNEEMSGTTTPYTIQNVKAGVHKILLRKEGYKAYPDSIMVEHRQVTPIAVKLMALLGQLSILVKPHGSIYIDGELRASDSDSPYATDLPAGAHAVKAVHPSLGLWEKEVDIEPDRLHEINIDFTKIVTITVVAPPVNGEIFVDNKSTGYWTPYQFKLPLGKHRIEVRREGYVLDGKEIVINLEDDIKEPLKFRLKKVQ